MSILLVDDDAEFRSLVTPVLEKLGRGVVCARTGEEADLLVRQVPPDLVVVDGLLPDTDGVGWIVRHRAAGNSTPVVYVTGLMSDPPSMRRLTRELGVALVIHKPIVPSVFAEQVEAVLNARYAKPARPLAALTPPPIASTADGLAALKVRYGAALPQKVRALSDELQNGRHNPNDGFVTARLLAHRMKGSAGSYGFPEVGAAAARLEGAILALQKAEPSVRHDAWRAVENALADLVRSTDQAQGKTGSAFANVLNARILVLDDNPSFLKLIDAIGQRYLIDIVRADSAAMALERASATGIDAAVIDVNLAPPDDASTVAAQLRSLPGNANLPLAFVSGDGSIESRVSAAHAGASMFFTKPIEIDGFAEGLRQLISLRQKAQPQVLVLDDDPDCVALLTAELTEAGMQVASIQEPAEIFDALDRVTPDLLLLDVVMPAVSGFDVCRMLRGTSRWQHLPVVFLSTSNEPDTRVGAFEARGDDFISKPIIPAELKARVQVRLERARLLRERSDHDSLTGLLLRRAFTEQLVLRMQEARRTRTPVSVCLIDLDHFKEINDKYGHLAGDRVLAALGKMLSSRLRLEDLRGRWGGEEFILGFPTQPTDTVLAVVQRIAEEFRQQTFQGDSGAVFHASFSAGIASWPDDGDTFEAVLRTADCRLYQAKQEGRDRVVGQVPPERRIA